MIHYDIPAADFPPQQFLRTLDALPTLPPAPTSSPLNPTPYLYQTLPPLPLIPDAASLTPFLDSTPLHPRSLHPPSISLALSGGVDSSVALFLLLEAGYSVHPIYLHTWDTLDESSDICPSSAHLADAHSVCRTLGVQLEVVDLVKEYWVGVFEGMVDGYRRGRTPNPDVACNREVKFGRLLEWVRERRGEGAMLATGHYARTQRVYGGEGEGGVGDEVRQGRDVPYVGTDMKKTLHDTLAYLDALKPRATLRSLRSIFSPPSTASPTPPAASDESTPSPLFPSASGRPLLTTRLLTALDARKDQTYFLSHIAPSTLPSLLFPLGSLLKEPHTRAIARHARLPTSSKPDSMGICMIGPRTLPTFLSHYLHLTPGRFVTPSGAPLAPHLGQEVYTMGQGAKVGGQRRRLYVAGKGEAGDVVVVDDRLHPMLLYDEVVVGDVQWMEGEPRGMEEEGREGVQLWARFRSTEVLRRVRVQRVQRGEGVQTEYRVVCVDVPHHLISPGQVVAFYLGEHCLGGGPIVRAGPSYHALHKRVTFRT